MNELMHRVLASMRRRQVSAGPDDDRLAIQEKQSELEQRIHTLEGKCQSLTARADDIERRYHDDHSYMGPERRTPRPETSH
jgi:hypothetical protein